MPIQYKKISPFDSSFQIVRTNPKLTGNIKLTVDSKSSLWLNSIDANDELSKDQYKKYAIDINVGHEAHVYNFFNKGKTPAQVIYDLREKVSLANTSKKFEDQYDFSNYFSGAKYLASKFYDEKFSYFAPLYLDQQIPEYFVIFKIAGAANYNTAESKAKFPFNKQEFTYDTFSNSEIIKVIDLTETSKLGKYLRNMLDNPMLPKAPLRVGFQKDQLTYFRGLSIKSGTYTQIGEDLYDFYKDAQPITGFEERMTLGFERNMVLHPFIVNLEFLFDDVTSNSFDINRYVGFYCNLIEIEKLHLDLDKHADRKVTTNTPLFKRKYTETENISVFQENSSGVDVFFRPNSLDLTELDDTNAENKDVFFPVLRDQDDFLYLIKNESINRDSTDSSMKLKLVNKKVDLGKFFGPDELFLQEKAASVNVRGTSYTEITFDNNLSHLDRFRLYHNNGTRVDARGVYDEFIGTLNYDLVPNTGDFYTFYDYQNNMGDQYYFNVGGTVEKMVDTIARMLNAVRAKGFTAYSFENRLFIKANSSGNTDERFSTFLQFINDKSYTTTSVFEIKGKEKLHGVKINFRGGGPGFQVTMDADNYEKIKANMDRLLIKTKEGWSKIVNVSKYAAIINDATSETRLSRLQALNKYDQLLSLQLESGHNADIKFGLCVIREYFRPRVGILSMFNIKDFDFDRLSSEYVKVPVIDLYKDFYVPQNEPLLMTDSKVYTSNGSGKFEINGKEYTATNDLEITGLGDNLSYRVIEGDCFLFEKKDPTSLTQGLHDKNEEQLNFSGFASISSTDAQTSSDAPTYKHRDKFTNGVLKTEYDFTNENFTKNFALKSKLIPYISKWAMLDGRDVRDNPYRLNTDLAFGTNNFTPDHFETVPNSDKMTHEWFYIESDFNYKASPNLLNTNKSYFDTSFNLDPNHVDSVLINENGFEDFFTYTPKLDGVEVGPSQFRYSTIKKDGTNDEAFFKGINFRFREVSPLKTLLANGKPTFVENSKRFNNYKFSTILKVVDDSIALLDTDPIKYRVIEHKTFKWISLVIEIRLSAINHINLNYLANISGKGLSIVTEHEVTQRGVAKQPHERYPDEVYNDLYGDYRLNFNDNGISDLTHAFLYYAKNKKFNSDVNSFSTTKLGNKLDFSTSGIDSLPTNFAINRVNRNYFIDLQDEITNTEYNAQFFLKMPGSNSDLIIKRSQLNNSNPKDLPFVQEVKYNKVFTEKISDINIEGLTSNSQYQIPSSSANYWSRFVNFQILGGKNYYENLFKYISFAFVKQAINSSNPIIKYETYEYGDGALHKRDNAFYLEIEDPEFIEKTALMTSEPESLNLAISTSISNSNRVGYNLFANDLTMPFPLSRYSGEYEVLFKTVSCFNSTFEIGKLGENLKFANIKINSRFNDVFEVKNFSHLKVSDSSILSLANDSKYEAVYPLINETPIGQNSYFLLSSNWDYGFHHKYTDKATSVPVSGTLRIGEDTSFLSKLINLPNAIELNTVEVTEIELSLLNNLYDDRELVFEEGLTSVTGVINITEVMVRYFLESNLKNNILSTFKDDSGNVLEQSDEFFGSRNAEQYVIDYIKTNLINLYTVESTEFYVKPQKGVVSKLAEVKGSNPNRIDFISLDDSTRFKLGYTVNKNVEINKLNDLLLKFKINKPTDASLLVSPKIKIRLI